MPRDILKIIAFCRDCGLPTTLEELGLAHAGDERLMQAASASCAPEETMGNMPFRSRRRMCSRQ